MDFWHGTERRVASFCLLNTAPMSCGWVLELITRTIFLSFQAVVTAYLSVESVSIPCKTINCTINYTDL